VEKISWTRKIALDKNPIKYYIYRKKGKYEI